METATINDTIDPTTDIVPTFYMYDPTEGEEKKTCSEEGEKINPEPLPIPALSKEQIKNIIDQLTDAPDFLEHFMKLPFVDYDFIYENDLEEYITGEEKEKYLRFKLRKKIADKKKQRNGTK